MPFDFRQSITPPEVAQGFLIPISGMAFAKQEVEVRVDCPHVPFVV